MDIEGEMAVSNYLPDLSHNKKISKKIKKVERVEKVKKKSFFYINFVPSGKIN